MFKYSQVMIKSKKNIPDKKPKILFSQKRRSRLQERRSPIPKKYKHLT